MNQERKIQVPAVIEGISVLKDKGLSVRLHTQEMSSAEKSILMDFHGSYGYFLFKESSFQESDIPKDDPTREDLKKPSQRLRNCLFVVWTQNTDKIEPFHQFYEREMEKLIEHYKAKLT